MSGTTFSSAIATTRRSLRVPDNGVSQRRASDSQLSSGSGERNVKFSLYGNRVYPTYSNRAYDRRWNSIEYSAKERRHIQQEIEDLRYARVLIMVKDSLYAKPGVLRSLSTSGALFCAHTQCASLESSPMSMNLHFL